MENTNKERNDNYKKPSSVAIRKEKSMGRKILDKFLSDDPIMAIEKVKNEVLWPGVKNLGYNILTSAISMMFWKEVRGDYSGGRIGRNARNDNYESYARYSDSRRASNERMRRPSYDYGQIIFTSAEAAKAAKNRLQECINQYERASVADLNEAAEITSKYTDRYYGWYDIKGCEVYGVAEGWIIDLPPAQPIRT